MSQPDAMEETAKAAPRTIPIRTIEITGFRGVRTGRVENLSALSILVGPNNCGKSTVLEAIAAVGSASDARAAFELLLRRGGSTVHALQHIFHSGWEARISTPDAVSLPTLTQLGTKDDFVLHTFASGHAPVPAFLAGDGVKRLLNIAATICDIDHGVVLLEEPESFQHPRYLRELAELLRAATTRGTQVILSTHSIELIDLLLGSDENTDEPWPTVHRLRLIAGELRAVAVSARDVRTLRHDLVEDLRT